MRISLVVAMDDNGLIGADGGMPWHLPADLRHFKRTTLGKPILMGRRTLESIGRPLPGRSNLVLSRQADYRPEGCTRVVSLAAARDLLAGDHDELMVIGGAQVYALALADAQRICLTRIHATFDGDTWFPDFDLRAWREVSREHRAADAKNPHACSFIELRRVTPE